jgi:hypothetical protein
MNQRFSSSNTGIFCCEDRERRGAVGVMQFLPLRAGFYAGHFEEIAAPTQSG